MKTYLLALASGAALLTSQAQAAIPIYPNPGTVNPIDYSFTAASTGDIIAYFAGNGGSLPICSVCSSMALIPALKG